MLELNNLVSLEITHLKTSYIADVDRLEERVALPKHVSFEWADHVEELGHEVPPGNLSHQMPYAHNLTQLRVDMEVLCDWSHVEGLGAFKNLELIQLYSLPDHPGDTVYYNAPENMAIHVH